MRHPLSIRLLTVLPAVVFVFAGCKAQTTAISRSLELAGKISMPHVSGRIDHLTFDAKNEMLFVAALGNNTIEVVDLAKKKAVRSVDKVSEPQGVVFLPQHQALVVAGGGTGTCDMFDSVYNKTASIQLGDDADNIRYEPASHKLYVGFGQGGIAVIDAARFKLLNKIDIKGHPESFQIDKSAGKLYVNVPDERQIDVIDLSSHQLSGKWNMEDAHANFPMALDEADHRLFIGCRRPSKLLVLDTRTGKVIASVGIDGDTDDLFYNASKKEIYASCGSGYVDVITQVDPDSYRTEGRIATRPGARTSLLVPGLRLLVVAAPASMNDGAQLLIYRVK